MIFKFKGTEYQLTDWWYLPHPNDLMIRRLVNANGKPMNNQYIGFRYNCVYSYYTLSSAGIFREIEKLYLELTKNVTCCNDKELKEHQFKIDDFLNRIDKLKIFI